MRRNMVNTIKYAIVVSRFNQNITDALLHGALERFSEHNINEKDLTIIQVPGAIEIPLIAKLLATTKKYKAILCLGAIIRGETGHYDYVCQQVSQGCQRVMLDYDIPVIFGVLTTDNEQQALDRVGGSEGHKGKDTADAAIEMVKVVEKILSLNENFKNQI
ncbi:MAG: 6,7-dimethyl-8-ribityllumazine synthase [Gammaproteobacteria bacterium]|nr:6,7-dimethyl-8-ribityllumazine synthase [Gammaproteobacteria bacterium]MCW5583995.1 6,7-dimethyl-8-ribityllumazine synthase [Gammaproteobacteria bacterium]